MQALQRSEEERRMGESPELRAPQPIQSAPGKRSRWPHILTLLLTLNALLLGGALFYFMQPTTPNKAPNRKQMTNAVPLKADPPIVTPENPPSTGKGQPQPALETLVPPPKVAPLASQYKRHQPQQNSTTAPPPTTKAAVTPPNPVQKETSDEGDSLQPTPVSEIAGVEMSVHVYSPDPRKRFVFINGKRYREGERLNNGNLVLKAINAEGIIIEHEGREELLQLEQ